MTVDISSLRPGDRVRIDAVVVATTDAHAGVFVSFDETRERTMFVPAKAIEEVVTQHFTLGDRIITASGYRGSIIFLTGKDAVVRYDRSEDIALARLETLVRRTDEDVEAA